MGGVVVRAFNVTLSHSEVTAANAELGQAATPSPTLYMVVMAIVFILAMEVGLSTAFAISQNVSMPWMVFVHQYLSLALPTLLFLLGLWTVNRTYNRMVSSRYLRLIAARGTPDTVAATFTSEPSGFRLSTSRGEWLARWDCIHALSRVSNGWMVGSDLSSLFVPRRAFADTAQEKQWVRATLDQLSEAAKAASPDALAFAPEAH